MWDFCFVLFVLFVCRCVGVFILQNRLLTEREMLNRSVDVMFVEAIVAAWAECAPS